MNELFLGAILVVAIILIAVLAWFMSKPDSDPATSSGAGGSTTSGWRSKFAPQRRSSGGRVAGRRGYQPAEWMLDSSTDLNDTRAGVYASSGDPYDRLAAAALAEDLDAVQGMRLFSDDQLPAEPITDDQFRYTGQYQVSSNDPWLSSPMHKRTYGESNIGSSIFSS